jgi:hypothetical protein
MAQPDNTDGENSTFEIRLKDLAPSILRKRLLVEGFFSGELSEARVREFLLDLSKRLGLRTYGEPVVYAPASGMGRDENAGFDAFVPLIDSGISAYFWTGPRFFSVLIYTCKDFDDVAAVDATRELLAAKDETVTLKF